MVPEIKQKIMLGFDFYSTKSRVKLNIDQGSFAFDRTNTEKGLRHEDISVKGQ